MKVGFLCPRCHDIFTADYHNHSDETILETDNPCICFDLDVTEWYEMIYNRWDNIVVLNLDKMKEDEIL